MEDQQYIVSRQFAAEILNVSIRTLDRYAKSDKITSMRRGRQLFFSEKELLDYKARQMAQEELEQVHKARRRRAEEGRRRAREPLRRAQNVQNKDFVDVEEAHILEQEGSYDDLDVGFADIKDSLLRRSPEESIYRSLFKKAELELKNLRQKLDVANYQVGKLGAQVASMVPLIEFKKQKHELLELSEENREKGNDIAQLEQQIKIEQWVKRIYAAFLFFMMGLMPLLVILRLFS